MIIEGNIRYHGCGCAAERQNSAGAAERQNSASAAERQHCPSAAILHGGPGAAGSALGLAAMAGEICPVMEPMQTAYTIAGQVEELKHQLISSGACQPTILAGHSWGAMLAVVFAHSHPDMVKKLILVGCPPLLADYVPLIKERRDRNLMPDERQELGQLTALLENGGADEQEKDRILKRLEILSGKGDSVDLSEPSALEIQYPVVLNGAQYAAVWSEAAELRATGGFLNMAAALSCPVTFIHGRQDPHPPEGFTEPLKDSGLRKKVCLLDACGHTPWRERRAGEAFFSILKQELLK